MSNECKGKNCKSVNGDNHSSECAAEHEECYATPGNRFPNARYLGYTGEKLHVNASDDEILAYQEGVDAREPKGIN